MTKDADADRHPETDAAVRLAPGAIPGRSQRVLLHAIRGRPGPDDRPPLPSGHPDTWDVINAGTCIAGASYPFPVFPR